MMCRNPYVRDPTGRCFSASFSDPEKLLDGIPFPCGQCLPCRINKRRVWTHRMILESSLYGDNSFVTLTYDNDHLPPGGVLVKKHLQDYIKRLRRKVEPMRIRYYACGEYGSESHRPHYHLIVFGLVPSKELYQSCWEFGNVEAFPGEPDTMQYVAGYVAKKLAYRFEGLVPEFALMSRKPGIGYAALEDVARLMTDKNFLRYLSIQGDVPAGLLHGSKFYPFGRFLKEKLRALCHLTYNPDRYFKEIRQGFFDWIKLHDKDNHFYVDYLVSLDDNKAKHQAARQKIFSRGCL